jgi:hypothetical protein
MSVQSVFNQYALIAALIKLNKLNITNPKYFLKNVELYKQRLIQYFNIELHHNCDNKEIDDIFKRSIELLPNSLKIELEIDLTEYFKTKFINDTIFIKDDLFYVLRNNTNEYSYYYGDDKYKILLLNLNEQLNDFEIYFVLNEDQKYDNLSLEMPCFKSLKKTYLTDIIIPIFDVTNDITNNPYNIDLTDLKITNQARIILNKVLEPKLNEYRLELFKTIQYPNQSFCIDKTFSILICINKIIIIKSIIKIENYKV